jgi:hypothetical protein
MPSTIIHVPHSHANLLNYISAKVVLHWWQSADSRMQVFLFLSIRMEMNALGGRSPLVSFTLSHTAFFFHCPGFMRIQASRKEVEPTESWETRPLTRKIYTRVCAQPDLCGI